MKRIISGVAVLGLGLIPILPSASSVSAQTAPQRTEFSFTASGYATDVSGGTVPVDSGKTALAVIGCTNEAPVTSTNRAAQANLDPLPVRVTNLRTRAESREVRRGFASQSTSTSDVRIGSKALGLKIAGLRTSAKAAFVRGESQATVDFSFVTATLAGIPIPLADLQEGIFVPGIGEVEFGIERTRERSTFAFARGRALRIVVTALGDPPTVITVGEATGRIDKRPFGGVFSGGANVGKTTALNGAARSGPVVNQPHKCAGTDGRWLEQNVAAGDLEGLGTVDTARARVRTDDFVEEGFATSRSVASVQNASLAGEIEVEGLVVKAYTRRNEAGTLKRNADGTSLGRLRIGGEEIEIPNPGDTINVRGVAKVTFQRVRHVNGGIDVTGLRIELLDGDGAVIELARAVSRIR